MTFTETAWGVLNAGAFLAHSEALSGDPRPVLFHDRSLAVRFKKHRADRGLKCKVVRVTATYRVEEK